MAAPLTTRSAITASMSESASPSAATSAENSRVILKEARYEASCQRWRKFSRPTNSTLAPKASSCCTLCKSACPAGQKKKMMTMASCGATSSQGSQVERKTTRFSM